MPESAKTYYIMRNCGSGGGSGSSALKASAMSKDDELFKDDELPPQNQRNRLPAPNKVPPKSIRANNQPHSLTVDIVVFPA
jgi:hypothetical protein